MSANSTTPNPDETQRNQRITSLVSESFGNDATVTAISDVGGGRGVFSQVSRVELSGATVGSAVAKLGIDGPNGAAAIASGAVGREALAYQTLLPIDGLATPTLHGLTHHDDGTTSFLLEDLTNHRRVDQLDGLTVADTLCVVDGLAALHNHFDATSPPAAVRRATPATFSADALDAGRRALSDRWEYATDVTDVFDALLSDRVDLVARFEALGATLCHGDPRADNLVFAADNSVVLFDWQQIAQQVGEADLAWLLATSLEPNLRAQAEPLVIERYASKRVLDIDAVRANLTTATILPGLAVLFLAQRNTESPRTEAFIRTSIERIAATLEAIGPHSTDQSGESDL